ncbi:MAG: glycosyltransferase [Pirellulales bacterium]
MSTSLDKSRRTLSVAMIVRDAESLLEETLASVASIADEIVVADTGSTDATREIAKRLATRVVDIPWQQDFASARNACFAQTTCDWVLSMDAGETLSSSTAQALRRFVDRRADPRMVYSLLISVPPSTLDVSAQQVARVRLLPRCDSIRYAGRVREHLNGSLGPQALQVQPLDLVIDRSSYDLRPDVRLRKAQRNLKLAEQEMEQHGPSARLWLVRGEAIAVLGDMQEARHCFRKAQHSAVAASDELLEAYYGQVATHDGTQADSGAQLDLCIEALQSFPVDMQLLCAMGNFLQTSGRLDLAMRTFETAVQCGEIRQNLWHLEDIEDVAVVCWAATLHLINRPNEACRLLENALSERPESVRIRRLIIELHIQDRDRDKALGHAEQMPEEFANRQAFVNAVRGACLARSGDWVAAEAYLETAYEDQCRDPICLRWLAAAYLQLEKTKGAQQVLRDWYEIEPDSEELIQLAEKLPVAQMEEATSASKNLDRQISIHRPALPGFQSLPPRPKSSGKTPHGTPSSVRRIDSPP